MGLLGEVSDDDSDDDDIPAPRRNAPAAPKGKNQALYEAMNSPATTKVGNSPAALPPSSGSPSNGGSQGQQQQRFNGRSILQQHPDDPFRDVPAKNAQGQDTRRPPPGLQMPPAAQPSAQLAGSPQFPASPQQMRQQQLSTSPQIDRSPAPASPRDVPSRTAARSPMPAPVPQRPAPAFMIAPPGSPAPPYSHTPPTPSSPMFNPTTPVQLPPSTPITPLFAAPPTTVTIGEKSGPKVSFIMRGGQEDALLDRSKKSSMEGSDESHSTVGSGPRKPRGGDDFWRRFSMVAHQTESDTKKGARESSWLVQTERRTRAYSRWVALSGIFILCLIAGGIACGIIFSKGQGNGHAAPVAIGGKEEESDITSIPASTSSKSHAASATGYVHQTMTTSNGVVVAVQRREFVDSETAPPFPSATPALDAVLKAINPPAKLPRHHHGQRRSRQIK